MAKKDNLLRDAIADAKLVKETALANAKLALEEAFTPHLTSMLSTKLRNEADDDFGAGDEEDVLDIDGSDDELHEIGTPEVEGEVDKSAVIQGNSPTPVAVKHDAEKLKSSTIGTGDNKKPADAEHTDNDTSLTEADENDPTDDAVDASAAWGPGEDTDDQDLDLESVIKELEADIDGVDTDSREELAPEDDMPMEAAPEAAFGDDTDELPPEDDMPMEAAPEMDPTAMAGEEDDEFDAQAPVAEAEPDMMDMDGGDDELDLDEILREIEDEETTDDLTSQNASLQSELKEYRSAVIYLRSKLNEVNLLNAKLLYTNRLFRDYSMDVRSKMRVVENFDRATTVREAKLVYATIAESFRGKGSVTRKGRSITEGLASRKTGSTAPKGQVRDSGEDTPTILAEGTALANRFKKLAGITKH